MKNKSNQYVIPINDDWIVKGELNKKIVYKSKNKSDAISRAFEIARNQDTKVFLKQKNGKIKELDLKKEIKGAYAQNKIYETERELPLFLRELINFYD